MPFLFHASSGIHKSLQAGCAKVLQSLNSTNTILVLVSCCQLSVTYGRASADERPLVTSKTIQHLAAEIEEADFERSNASRIELKRIINSRGPFAVEAMQTLQTFNKCAFEWAVKVGNDRALLETSNAPPLALSVLLRRKESPNDFKYLFGVPSLRILRLQGKGISDGHLSVLSHMPNLEILDAYDTSISGASFERLKLPALQVLHLSDCPVTDEGMSRAVFPKLQVLDLSGTDVTNVTIEKLIVTELRDLNIQRTDINAVGVGMVGRFTGLEVLRVDLEDVTPDNYEKMVKMPFLRKIQLQCEKQRRKEAELFVRDLPRTIEGTIYCHVTETK